MQLTTKGRDTLYADACSLDLEVYTADTDQGSSAPEGTANALMNRAIAAAATEVCG